MRVRPAALLGLAVAGILLSSPVAAQRLDKPEEFSAIYSNIGTVGAVGALPVTMRITRWTDEDEHQRLMKELADGGTDALVRGLTRAKSVGGIGTPQELPYDLRYARQTPLEGGGRKIILMTDRPMSFVERLSASVTRDYPITWIELRLGADGRGEGTMSIAARLRLVGDILGIEDFATQPAKLNDIKKVR
jgi:hypothetical protein